MPSLCNDRATGSSGIRNDAADATSDQPSKQSVTKPIDPRKTSRDVRAVFDDIKKTRGVPDVNNFWKHLANDPKLLKRTWESVKETMAPGALDPLTKEM